MNKLAYFTLVATLSLSLLEGKTTIPSYTNTDLDVDFSGTAHTQPNTIPGLNTQAQTNQQTTQKYPDLTPEQRQAIVDQMNAQVQISKERVQGILNMLQDQSRVSMDSDRAQLENAAMVLDVKQILVGKFANSPSLKSPKVQAALMQILTNPDIQAGDLAAFQGLVDSERPLTYP